MNNTFDTHNALYKAINVKVEGRKAVIRNGERILTEPMTPKEADEMASRLEKIKRCR